MFEYSNIEELETKMNDLQGKGELDINDDSVRNDDYYYYHYNYDENPNFWPGYQVIGVHITGQQIKGPEEAEGYNVDFVGMCYNFTYCRNLCVIIGHNRYVYLKLNRI